MSPIVSGHRKQIGWFLVPADIPEADVDWTAAQTFCVSHRPFPTPEGMRIVPVYSDEFKGDRLLCENCGKEFEFEKEEKKK
jgi:hypothetical protein